MNKEEWEKQLKEKQAQHLEKINKLRNKEWEPCKHDQCESCHGTWLKLDGTHCVHYISCDCPKCLPHRKQFNLKPSFTTFHP